MTITLEYKEEIKKFLIQNKVVSPVLNCWLLINDKIRRPRRI